jgi:hypothetical protein
MAVGGSLLTPYATEPPVQGPRAPVAATTDRADSQSAISSAHACTAPGWAMSVMWW